VRALPAAVTLMDQARARKHDTDLGNRLTDQASGLLGRDAVLTVIGLQNAGKVPDCGAPAREQVTGLAGAGDAGIGTVILIGDHEYVFEDRGARRVREDPAAPLNLAAEMRYGAHGAGGRTRWHCPGIRGARGRVMAWPAAGGRRGEEDEQA
jgi:hypothetical protein